MEGGEGKGKGRGGKGKGKKVGFYWSLSMRKEKKR